MKRLIISAAILLGLTGLASAQSNQSATTLTHSKAYKAKATAKKKSSKQKKNIERVSPQKSTSVVPVVSNRNELKWSTGQKATPTGNDAAPVNSEGYLSLKKDTTQKGKPKQ